MFGGFFSLRGPLDEILLFLGGRMSHSEWGLRSFRKFSYIEWCNILYYRSKILYSSLANLGSSSKYENPLKYSASSRWLLKPEQYRRSKETKTIREKHFQFTGYPSRYFDSEFWR